MPRTTRAVNDRHIRCETCLKEIPRTEAYTREGDDYVLFFCGLDCHEQWLKSAPARESEAKQGKKEKD